MPVDSKHAQYIAQEENWRTCRDVFGGQAKVHAAKERYLPRLKDQTDEDYNAYRERASFFNASGRTRDGLAGMIFRKPPVIEVTSGLRKLLDDINMDGLPIEEFARNIAEDMIETGRAGILVDYTRTIVGPRTVAEAEASGERPYMVAYDTEAIINWRYAMTARGRALTLVVLAETHEEPEDEFSVKREPQLRVLSLTGGRYSQNLYRKVRDESTGRMEWVLVETIVPQMKAAPLDFIPFVIVTADASEQVIEPPLLDLAFVNVSHYKTTADLEHGAHFTGLPTPVVAGYRVDNAKEKLYVGSQSAWVFPDPAAKAYYLEFSGAGLGYLETRLEKKEAQMAALGARMLAPEKRQAEAAETAAIHRSGESSVLAAMARTISRKMRAAIEIVAKWAGTNDADVKFELNTDFFPVPMDSSMLTALVAAWQQGAMSKQALFENLKRGEIISETTTFDDEEARIGDEPPSLANQLALAGAKAPDGANGDGAD